LIHQYKEKGTILKADKINLSFGDKKVLRDVSFEIKDITRDNLNQGQIVSLIGRSGIGKSQLFKILSGLNRPTSGEVKIGLNQSIVNAGEVGIVPQNYILFKWRTILKNLVIAAGKNADIELILAYAEDFHLTEHLNKFPEQLSGGQRQRVSILQQMLTGNKFILMDEPFASIDSIMIDKVMKLITKISLMHEENTIVIVSHDISNSLAISDIAFVLAKKDDKEGATITKTIDLKKMGLAWREDIKRDSQFRDLVEDVKGII
jgi:ABC-type nitrate/sulfonate/bicarbonate transport system ATPase subunit